MATSNSCQEKGIENMGPFETRPDGVIWRGDGETLYVQAWGQDSLRVRAVPCGDLIDTDYALIPPEATDVSIQLDGDNALIQNGDITARMEAVSLYSEQLGYRIQKCSLSFFDADGDLLIRELEQGGSLNLKARDYLPLAGTSYEIRASFEPNPHEKLFGMGQYQQEILDLKGSTLELAHRNSQASVPFVVSSEGYGLLWHDPAIGKATFATNRSEWVARNSLQLDYWITAGKTPAQIATAYAKATGFAPRIPDYALGYWQCKLRYSTQEELLEVAREHQRREIPLSVIVADFFHWPKMGDFRFEEEFWPDPKGMVQELEDMGVELMVSVWPQISLESENYPEFVQNNLTVHTDRGMDIQMAFQGAAVFADMTNPRTRARVWELCKANYHDIGIKTFWLDEAEPEYGVYDWDNYRYHQGPVTQVGNLYPQAFARGFYEGQREAGQEEIVNLLRCVWAGSQRYGALAWSGDIHSTWTDLRRQIVAGLQMGIAGIPWFTTDIGGFHGGNINDPEFHELLIRWFQFGALSPVMRMHGDRQPFTEITAADGTERCRTGAANEVWSYGSDVEAILRSYIDLRENLRPYMRSVMDLASSTGAPVMRPLFFDFPDDPNAWNVADQYMLGSDLLVAPVTEAGSTVRKVYLPEGAAWISGTDGNVLEGGSWVEVSTPLRQLPLFMRSGSELLTEEVFTPIR